MDPAPADACSRLVAAQPRADHAISGLRPRTWERAERRPREPRQPAQANDVRGADREMETMLDGCTEALVAGMSGMLAADTGGSNGAVSLYEQLIKRENRHVREVAGLEAAEAGGSRWLMLTSSK